MAPHNTRLFCSHARAGQRLSTARSFGAPGSFQLEALLPSGPRWPLCSAGGWGGVSWALPRDRSGIAVPRSSRPTGCHAVTWSCLPAKGLGAPGLAMSPGWSRALQGLAGPAGSVEIFREKLSWAQAGGETNPASAFQSAWTSGEGPAWTEVGLTSARTHVGCAGWPLWTQVQRRSSFTQMCFSAFDHFHLPVSVALLMTCIQPRAWSLLPSSQQKSGSGQSGRTRVQRGRRWCSQKSSD